MEKFKVNITAESPDGKSITCHTDFKCHCSANMAVSVIANALEKNQELKTIFAEALLLVMSGEKFSEQTTMDDYLDAVLKAKEDSKTEL